MRRENTYLEFGNPIHTIWRSGKSDDPYIDRLDISKVVNQRIVLLEIPDEFYRVRIAEMKEINYERFIKDTLAINEFYVDYNNGFIYFHHSKEAQTISIVYKGRGFLLYPASRIVSNDGTDSTQNLQEIIETVREQVRILIDETQNFEEVMKNMVIATNLTKEATDGALNATQEALNAVDLVEDAYKTTVLFYLPYVQTASDIATTYPNPRVGHTTMAYDTGVRYRWNGAEWVPIDAFGGNIPLASEIIDGLLSKEMYKKVDAITENVDTRVIVFIIPQEVLSGIQDPHPRFPFNGTIESISASISHNGSSDTSIRIEKSSDYQEWNTVTDNPVVIKAREHFDDKAHAITDTEVKKGDIFRLYIPYSGDVQNLTLNVEIKIED